MQLADIIKYLPATLIALSLGTVIYITEHASWLIWYWLTFPMVLPLFIAMLQLAGKLKSQVIPVSGAITSVLPLPFYLESLNVVPDTDGQAALIFAIMPVYQLVGLVGFSSISYAILAWKKKQPLR